VGAGAASRCGRPVRQSARGSRGGLGVRQRHLEIHEAAEPALRRRVGVVINPATPATVLEEILQDVDQVLVMTVNPGFGHQRFIHTMLPKIRRVRQMIDDARSDCDLEVDGGIDATTAPLVIDAGANVLVSGSAIFSDGKGVIAAMNRLRAAMDK